MKTYPPNARGEIPLSSSWTPLLRYVLFPWVSGALGLAGIYLALLDGLRLALLLVPVLVFVVGLGWWTARGLRRVVATEEGLLIGHGRRSVLVPYDQVAAVETPRPGWPSEIRLRRFTPFGSTIRFLPGPLRPFFVEHPALRLLRERAGLGGRPT